MRLADSSRLVTRALLVSALAVLFPSWAQSHELPGQDLNPHVHGLPLHQGLVRLPDITPEEVIQVEAPMLRRRAGMATTSAVREDTANVQAQGAGSQGLTAEANVELSPINTRIQREVPTFWRVVRTAEEVRRGPAQIRLAVEHQQGQRVVRAEPMITNRQILEDGSEVVEGGARLFIDLSSLPTAEVGPISIRLESR